MENSDKKSDDKENPVPKEEGVEAVAREKSDDSNITLLEEPEIVLEEGAEEYTEESASDNDDAGPPVEEEVVIDATTNSSGGATDEQDAEHEEGLSRSLGQESLEEEIEIQMTAEERRHAAEQAARDLAHTLGLSQELTTEIVFAAGNQAQFSRGALDLTKIVETETSKVLGSSREMVQLMQEQAINEKQNKVISATEKAKELGTTPEVLDKAKDVAQGAALAVANVSSSPMFDLSPTQVGAKQPEQSQGMGL